MSCADTVLTLPGRYTAGDLEDPIRVTWGEVLTTETSELRIDRPGNYASVTVPGALIDGSVGAYEYAWRAGDLVAGEGQLVKARLYRAGPRRKSTEYFKINVDDDVA